MSNNILKTEFRAPSEKTVFGHPAGVLLVSSTEMWERFSYFGLSAILVLFLVAPTANGGFGWSNSDAVWLYGLYSGLAFSMPAIGGWFASRYLGERKSIVIGGILIVFGHVFIGAPGYIPWLLEAYSGIPVEQLLVQSSLSMGEHLLSSDATTTLKNTIDQSSEITANQAWVLNIGYLSKGWGLSLGLCFIIIGTAFLKGPISSIVGKLYAKDDTRKEAGFTLFMVGIWMGALLAELIIGAISEQFGWHLGLAAAGLGMVLGLTNFLLKQEKLLGDVGKACDMSTTPTGEKTGFYLSTDERRKMVGLAIMAVFTVIFSIAYNQYGGVFNLLIYNNVDRNIGSFQVPAAWFITVTTLGFILLAPLATKFYAWVAQKGYELSVAQKQALGLLAIALGYLVLLVPATQHEANVDALLNAGWIITAYLFFAIGDVFIWPPQIAAVSSYAPERYQAFIIGLWYVTYGLGGLIAGLVAPYAYSLGLIIFTGTIFSVCALGACCLILLRSRIAHLLTS